MKMTKGRVLVALVLSILAIFVSACSSDTYTIAVVLPLSGDDSVYGQAVKEGIELAFEEFQASEEGAPFEILIEDSQSDPAKAAELLDKLYGDGALIALGGVTTPEAKTMTQTAESYDRVLVSPSASSPELTDSRNFYRIWPSDFAAASKMAQFLSKDLKIEQVVVVAESQDYAQGIQGTFVSAYEGYGGEVLEVVEFPPNTVEFSGLMERVMTLDPKAVYLAAYGDEIGSMIQELRRRDYEGKILTTSAFATPAFIAPVGEDAAGVILTQSVFELDSDFAHIKTFREGFKSKHGNDPDIYAAHGYDALRVIHAAMKGRAPLTTEVPKGLRDSVIDFPGVTGTIQFNEKGDVQRYPRIYIIGKDLLLQDYNERVRQQQEEIKRKREELKKRLDKLNQSAKQMSDG